MGQAASKRTTLGKWLIGGARPQQENMTTAEPAVVESSLPIVDGDEINDIKSFAIKSTEPGRLNAQHRIFHLLLKDDYAAPVTDGLKRGIKVIDVGCGTGIWSLELARRFPASTFIGTDMYPVFAASQPTAPANCTFSIADTTKGLPFESDTFDYAFQRIQMAYMPAAAWPGVVVELVRVAKPGAYVEMLEAAYPTNCGPALAKHTEWLHAHAALRDIQISVPSNPDLLISAGLISVQSRTIHWPLGWGDNAELLELSVQNYITVLRTTKHVLCTALGLEEEEFDKVAIEAEREITEEGGKYKATLAIFSHYGKKPGGEGE